MKLGDTHVGDVVQLTATVRHEEHGWCLCIDAGDLGHVDIDPLPSSLWTNVEVEVVDRAGRFGE